MSIKVGIVGLPNAGKSTLFNAMVKGQKANAENFPFCTIDPNVGVVEVPDVRLKKISEIVNPEKTIFTSIEFFDIAGLVKGASKGEGLGNKFLSHIRECAAIVMVLRFFEDSDISHVEGGVNPKRDKEILETELLLSDLESLERKLERTRKASKSGDKKIAEELGIYERLYEFLSQGNQARDFEIKDKNEKLIIKSLFLLTSKPIIYAANISEDMISNFNEEEAKKEIKANEKDSIIPVSAKIESELIELKEEEKKEFLNDLGIKNSTLENLIIKSYDILGLQTFFTAGPKEAKAWTVKKGAKAPQAAGVIHTDFEKGFIKAEVVSYSDFVESGGELKAKEKGLLRIEGKDYIFKDGDIVHFRFAN